MNDLAWRLSGLPLGIIALSLNCVLPGLASAQQPQGQPESQPAPEMPSSEMIDPATAASKIVTALSSPAGGPSQPLAQTLVDRLQGLTQKNRVNPYQLVQAIRAFNAVVEASNDDYLSNPPPEFLSIHDLLSKLSGAATSASQSTPAGP